MNLGSGGLDGKTTHAKQEKTHLPFCTIAHVPAQFPSPWRNQHLDGAFSQPASSASYKISLACTCSEHCLAQPQTVQGGPAPRPVPGRSFQAFHRGQQWDIFPGRLSHRKGVPAPPQGLRVPVEMRRVGGHGRTRGCQSDLGPRSLLHPGSSCFPPACGAGAGRGGCGVH